MVFTAVQIFLVGRAFDFYHDPTSFVDGCVDAFLVLQQLLRGEIELMFPAGSTKPRYFEIDVSRHRIRLGARKKGNVIEIATIEIRKL